MDPTIDALEIKHIEIINRNPFTITDRFDNQIYKFESGKPVVIPIEAAAHIFGFAPTATEEQCMFHCLKRFGYNTPGIMASKQHEVFWENLIIRPKMYRMVEVLPEPVRQHPVEQVLETRTRRGRPKKRKLYARPPEIPAEDTAPATEAV